MTVQTGVMRAPGPATAGWFKRDGLTADPAPLRLYCLPHAGGGASAYRGWGGPLGPGIEVVPVQLPGREARFAEEPATSAEQIVSALAGPLAAQRHRRWALFGHSMGALLAYELAHRLTAAGRPPEHLFVSGMSAPPIAAARAAARARTAPLGGGELRARVTALGGTPREVLDSPELMELLLPVFRADYLVCDGYTHTPRPPLELPVTALGGASDHGVPASDLEAWRPLTSSAFAAHLFPGGHFYLHDHREEVLRRIRRTCMPSL